MNTKAEKILISVLSASLLSACGGGDSQTSSAPTNAQNPSHILVNGDKALSTTDAGYIYTPLKHLHLAAGKTTTTKIYANGESQAAVLKSLQCRGQYCSDLIKISNVTSTSADVNVTVPQNQAPGTYSISLHASDSPNAAVVSMLQVHVSSNSMIKASYLDMGAPGSLATVTSGGYAASNVILFAFADTTTPNINPSYLQAMQTAINAETQGTVNFLSIGGQNGNAGVMANTDTVISNITAQINAYNNKLKNGKIDGVDLDLEGDFTSDQILALAKGFKAANLRVSVAPQVYYSTGSNVDAENPTNLVLTSGGSGINQNVYGAAIANGYVDYIMAQTYNTGKWTVNNYAENQVEFFSAIARALDVSVKDSCANATTLCIPNTTKIVIGEPANAGAGGAYTIFNATHTMPPPAYNQATILKNLKSQVDAMNQNPTKYGNISGVMMWALGNDYAPQLYSDSSAVSGAFSSTIFGAPVPPQLPYFIMQISNTGPNAPGPGAYASATIVVEGAYWNFGYNSGNGIPIAPGNNQPWGTITSAHNPQTPTVADSGNLDQIFANGKTSFVAQQIIINGYQSQDQGLGAPTSQVNCPAGTGYTFEAGKSYNVMVNAATGVCQITVQ